MSEEERMWIFTRKFRASLYVFSIAIQTLLAGVATVKGQDTYLATSYTSDVDSSASKGLHSNFLALQIGPDAIFDVITEENTNSGDPPNYDLDMELQWTNVACDKQEEVLAIFVDKGNNTHSFDAAGGYVAVGGGTADWGSVAGTISFWIQWDVIGNRPWGQHTDMEVRFFGTHLVLDWGGFGSLTSSTGFVAGKWYFVAIVWNEISDELLLYVGDQDAPPVLDAHNNLWSSSVSTLGVIENNFMASRGGIDPTDGRGDDLRYWNIDRRLAEIASDYDSELHGSEPTLRSYFKFDNNLDDAGPDNKNSSVQGSYSFSSDVPFDPLPSENIRVDVWSGSSWQTILSDLLEGWNNASVSLFLNSTTFTIRFKGETDVNDLRQDSWKIDVALLNVWSVSWPVEWIVGIFCVLACGILLPLAMRFRGEAKRNKPASSEPTLNEQYGVTHDQLAGKKILLEVDPTISYHTALLSFASEVVGMEQQLVIFTSRNSALHTSLSDERVAFFLLTPKTSSSKKISKSEVLVPISDLSILLDAFIKVTRTNNGKPVTILFDNLSDTILMCGFEKTYKFLRFLLETLSSPEITTLFIFNPTAHDSATSSSIRGLFHFRLADLRMEQN